MKKFKPPEYWENINKIVQEDRFLDPFADLWGRNSTEFDIIKRADKLATKIHDGDVRKLNGEPYIYHPRRAALYLAFRLGIYGPYVTAGELLHDAPEDHPNECPVELIEEEFSYITAVIAEGLRKPSGIGLENYPEVRSRLKAMKVKAAGDMAILAKGAERNDNTLTPHGDAFKQRTQIAFTESHILPLVRREPVLFADLSNSIKLRKKFLKFYAD